ncbi:GNAT family N-acetyltransferase [Natrinema halophilum]|uniref:GNAT family N-acetyltransferase n=1 Tax=Natrinema halophilum TaxID=1699371 RepID=A0A7D5KCD8_9EURY|nr:GNAT family N-acetyltransferase [Natrinema halophilum]QLG48501.1 GNAT family N-acetyltransferase [Natrinema halophilum]
MDAIDIEELTTEPEWRNVFPLINQLRDHLTEETYLAYLDDMREEGYRLFGLFEDGEALAVAGVAIRTNFYNGTHLFVYDLVTRADRRSEGHGTTLMEFLEDWARDNDCESITLESGLWRENAHRFYEDGLDMDRYCYTFKKELDSKAD